MTDENALVACVFDLMTRLRLTLPEGDPMTSIDSAFDVVRELRDNERKRHRFELHKPSDSALWFAYMISGLSYPGAGEDLNEAILLAAEKALKAWAKEEGV